MTKPPHPAPLPQHVEDAIQQIAAMHIAHHKDGTAMERLTDRATAFVGRPFFLFMLFGGAAVWMGLGLVLPVWGIHRFDEAPYPVLDLFLSLAALLIAVLILASQRRDDRLANRREQMALQIALLSEQKASKIIDLLEELRRDLPNVHNRIDLAAIEMTGKSDHVGALDEIADRSGPDRI